MAWECNRCGSRSTSAPCDDCGSEAGQYTGLVWLCPDCGRQSQKNNPPCPRCGGMNLERTRPDYGDLDDEIAVPGYDQFAKPLVPVVAVLALVLVLFATGVVPLPESLAVALNGPGVEDAPGSAEEADGLNLSAVETGVLDRVDDHRAERGDDALARDDTLREMAVFANQRRVVADYGDGSVRGSLRDFSPGCRVGVTLFGSGDGPTTVDEFDDESDVADALFAALVDDPETAAAVEGAIEAHGVDVHVAPDGRLRAAYVVC